MLYIGVKIAVNDAEAQAAAEANADDARLREIVDSLPTPEQLKQITIKPLDFEKVWRQDCHLCFISNNQMHLCMVFMM